MAYFKMFIDEEGQFYFKLYAPNGEAILTSDGYQDPNSCHSSIESIRMHALFVECYERKARANGTYSFLLKALNGKVLASSKSYADSASLDAGIGWVKRFASAAEADELLQAAS